MVVARSCRGINEHGQRCRAAPIHASDFCVFHDPEYAETLQEARRAGGQRRRREVTLAGAYSIEALDSIPSLYRLLEIVTFDALSLENSVARGRLILGAIAAGVKLVEVGGQEERIASLEAALGIRVVERDSGRRR